MVPETFEIPDIPELRLLPARITDEDARELRWFMNEPQVAELMGASASGASSFGAQLERAALLGFGHVPCRRCGGTWTLRRTKNETKCEGCSQLVHKGADKCPHCHRPCMAESQDGTGWAPGDRFGKRAPYSQALAQYRSEQKAKGVELQSGVVLQIVIVSRHHESAGGRRAEQLAFQRKGQVALTHEELRAMFPTLPEEECKPCSDCKGTGVLPRRATASHKKRDDVTAWPTGSSKQFGGTMRDDEKALRLKAGHGGRMIDGNTSVNLDELERYTHMSMTLRDAAEVSPLARLALERYFRPLGGSRQDGSKVTARSLPRLIGRPALRELTQDGTEREVSALEDFMGRVWNLVAWGAQ